MHIGSIRGVIRVVRKGGNLSLRIGIKLGKNVFVFFFLFKFTLLVKMNHL